MRRGAIILTVLLAAACASPNEEPLVEYPPGPAEGASADPTNPGGGGEGDPTKPKPTPAAPPDEPMVGTKLWDGVTWFEGVTTDGHVVMTKDDDLVVLPAGATQPTLLVKDYDSSYDMLVVKGRLATAWLGDDVLPSAITTWSAAGGLKSGGPVAMRGGIYPKPASEAFAFRGKATSATKSTLGFLLPGQTTPTTLLTTLDNGVIEPACRPTIAWANDALLVGGCTDATLTYRVELYATDGSGSKTTILDGAASGVWPNRARSKVVVQTAAASSIRPLNGVGAALPLDTQLRSVVFSADDSKVVYLRADGKVRRAATTAPVAPVDLGNAIALLGTSPDARFTAYATKRDASSERTDVVLADATNPTGPKTLAAEKAIFHGFSTNGAALVYQTTPDIGATGPLFVQPTNGSPAVKLSDEAQRVLFDGDVVYFQEFVKASKTNVLKAAKISAPTPIVVEASVDPLTTQTALAAGKLFVANKVALWSYPALKP